MFKYYKHIIDKQVINKVSISTQVQHAKTLKIQMQNVVIKCGSFIEI